jgi:hypothetical protein
MFNQPNGPHKGTWQGLGGPCTATYFTLGLNNDMKIMVKCVNFFNEKDEKITKDYKNL